MEIIGIIHAHSLYSYDAKLSLAEIKALCQKNGMQFVCMTEHTDALTPERAMEFVRECDALSDESFCFVPGFEVPYERAHVLMIGARNFLGNFARTYKELREWTEEAPFVVLAHPVRNRFVISDILLGELHGLEVWNEQYEGKQVPRTRSIKLFEKLRKKNPTLVAIGGIDLHRASHFGSPRITLNVSEVHEAPILEKLKMGAFRVHSSHASFYGVLPDTPNLIRRTRVRSFVAVSIIFFGKMVNATLARLGLSLPKALIHSVRQRV